MGCLQAYRSCSYTGVFPAFPVTSTKIVAVAEVLTSPLSADQTSINPVHNLKVCNGSGCHFCLDQFESFTMFYHVFLHQVTFSAASICLSLHFWLEMGAFRKAALWAQAIHCCQRSQVCPRFFFGTDSFKKRIYLQTHGIHTELWAFLAFLHW